MKRLIAISVLVMLTAACTPKEIIRTEYVERKVPVNSVPQPPKAQPPVYTTSTLTAEQRKDLGTVAKAVAEDSKRKDGYIAILEAIVNKYKELADKSELQTFLIVPGVNDEEQAPKP